MFGAAPRTALTCEGGGKAKLEKRKTGVSSAWTKAAAAIWQGINMGSRLGRSQRGLGSNSHASNGVLREEPP
jgi:hypothetical protein